MSKDVWGLEVCRRPRARRFRAKAESNTQAEDRGGQPVDWTSSLRPQLVEPRPGQHRGGKRHNAHEFLRIAKRRPERYDVVEDLVEAPKPSEGKEKHGAGEQGQHAQVASMPGPEERQTNHGNTEVETFGPQTADDPWCHRFGSEEEVPHFCHGRLLKNGGGEDSPQP